MLEAPDRKTRGGAIVNITSQMGHVGAENRTVYCMTKHAIEGLTKAMALELAPHNIRVNSVAPTFVETPMTAPMFAQARISASGCTTAFRWGGSASSTKSSARCCSPPRRPHR